MVCKEWGYNILPKILDFQYNINSLPMWKHLLRFKRLAGVRFTYTLNSETMPIYFSPDVSIVLDQIESINIETRLEQVPKPLLKTPRLKAMTILFQIHHAQKEIEKLKTLTADGLILNLESFSMCLLGEEEEDPLEIKLDLRELAFYLLNSNIESLDFYQHYQLRCNLVGFQHFAMLPKLTTVLLEYVSIDSNSILGFIENTPGLRQLYLFKILIRDGKTNTYDEIFTRICQLNRLEVLEIENGDMTLGSLVKGLNDSQSLVSIELRYFNLLASTEQQYKGERITNRHLKSLKLFYTKFPPIEKQWLVYDLWNGLSSIETIDTNDEELIYDSINRYHFKTVTIVHMSIHQFNSKAIGNVIQLNLPQLENIMLRENPLNESTTSSIALADKNRYFMDIIEALQHNKSLKKLTIGFMVGYEMAIKFLQMKHPSIAVIGFKYVVGWEIQEFISALIGNQNIQDISVSNIYTMEGRRESVDRFYQQLSKLINSKSNLRYLFLRQPEHHFSYPTDTTISQKTLQEFREAINNNYQHLFHLYLTTRLPEIKQILNEYTIYN
ncbi:hypothetical protein DLAC_01114 [Tieghemostelium lacteum]|uniref:Uncharacterized protein n=1 Tax=Tieghemostelium lacteum TaxID=361077 RepID=A0A152A7S1_TIELA|nr:hypothetical protein DLAC_01114 [Tieghemostelium lacteum]|eukprot:KYR02283.1 hypothetical protein DLAC_01114 [Tieghemostelium lacteum]